MAIDYVIIDMLMPLMIILIPAVIVYVELGTRVGFVGGAIIGMTVGVSGGVVQEWVLILGILALGTILFLERESIMPGGGA